MNGEVKTNSRSSKPMCLSRVASLVYSILEQKKKTTFAEVADSIVNLVTDQNTDVANDQRTMRRRVYDVLNVLCAAHFISKEQKIITYNPEVNIANANIDNGSSNLREAEERLEQKERTLMQRVTLLLFFKLLFNRNKQMIRPPNTVQLPAIFVGFSDLGNGQIHRSLDGKRLEIVAQSTPQFFSHNDLYRTLRFPIEQQINCLRQMPQIQSIENLLFPNQNDQFDQSSNYMQNQNLEQKNQIIPVSNLF
ncbi:hypothetical protein M9Y10_021648 [Tritrichomonas musculus]|uniref:E2F/DP family winged-helix DNA-binding domain-containing protein n=1 Tax=Tritrichomonas musculus TaxID=1915356 RepID=A0ABR2KQA8_9EUKA